jgi:enediyne biosynthesis protein E4
MFAPRAATFAFLAALLSPLVAGAATLVFSDISGTVPLPPAAVNNESLAWGDYDNDGDDDLYLTVDGSNRLLRNDGGGVFVDVTTITRTQDSRWSVGCAWGDLDNDGDLDLFVLNHVQNDRLFRNDGPTGPGGEFQFTPLGANVGFDLSRTSRGIAFFDYDRDGLLDIYCTSIGDHALYHNLGGLQFADVAASLGVVENSSGVGVVCTDLDKDGWLDIYTGNRSNDPSRLFRNLGGTFTEIGAAAGVDKASLGMGVLSFDYDNDLDFDLYWTTFPSVPLFANAQFENTGNFNFVNRAATLGTEDLGGFGISGATGDLDLDGWVDFVLTNGALPRSTANVVFHSQSGTAFTDATASIGGGLFDGRGVALADYDRDGDLDLCITGGPGAATRLWRNDTVRDGAFLSVRLVGTTSNRSAIGARVEVATTEGGQMREVSGGHGRGNQDSLPIEFGLGTATLIDQIDIFWPSGQTQTLGPFAVNQFLQLQEPTVVAILLPAPLGTVLETAIALSWPPLSPTIDRLQLQRRSSTSDFRLLAEWSGREVDHARQWADRNPFDSGSMHYRLRAHTSDGWSESGETTVNAAPALASGRRIWASPNPFNPRTTISFIMSEAGTPTLRIVGARGRVIRTHRFVGLARGTSSWVWDGTDEQGAPVGSGTYRAVVESHGKRQSATLTLVR